MEMGTLDLAGSAYRVGALGAIGLTVLAAYLFSLLTTIARGDSAASIRRRRCATSRPGGSPVVRQANLSN